MICFNHHHSVLPKGSSFTASVRNQGCSSTEGRSSTANSGTKAAVLLGINRCGSFPLLFAPHSLFSIWTDRKRSEKIPGAPTWRWGEWIWLTGPSGLHRNSLQGLNISSVRVSDQIRDPEIPIILRPHLFTIHKLFGVMFFVPQCSYWMTFFVHLHINNKQGPWNFLSKVLVISWVIKVKFLE